MRAEQLVGLGVGDEFDESRRLTSRARAGVSEVTMEFGWGTNMDFASLDVREKLDLVQLPRDAEKPSLLRFDPSNDPILRVVLSGGANLVELRQFADKTVKKDLESLDGIAAVKINGGLEEEIHVFLDEEKLRGFAPRFSLVLPTGDALP